MQILARTVLLSKVLFLFVFSSAFAAADGRVETLTIHVPGAEGGGFDRTGMAIRRALLAEGLVDDVRIVRSPGAGGLIALAQFFQTEDPHDLSVLVGGRTILGAELYNRSVVSLANATPIARLNGAVITIAVQADSPVRNLGDLIEAIRSNPELVQWVGGSIGSTDQTLVNRISSALGVGQEDIHYRGVPGGGDLVVEKLIENDLTAAVSTAEEFVPFVESGALRFIAVSTEERILSIDAPTLREFGLELSLTDWRGVFGPPGLRVQDAQRLETLFATLAGSEAWAGEIEGHKWQNNYQSGADFAAFLAQENALVADQAKAGDAPSMTTEKLVQIIGRQYRWAIIAALLSAVLVVALVIQRRRNAERQLDLREELLTAREEAARASEERDRSLAQAGSSINDAFDKWKLTAAENEIGWMLLKGLSFREIARARGTSERTVRQQARAIYAKSGLNNRSDLSAYFLEDFCFGSADGEAEASQEANGVTGVASPTPQSLA